MRVHRLMLAMFLLGAATRALAEEGRIPIFEPVVLDGTAGEISGQYVVTRNIAATSPAHVIHIIGTGEETIDIDLNGFTLTGGAAGPRAILANNVGELRIHDGSVRGLSTGWVLINATGGGEESKLTVERVRMSRGEAGVATAVSNIVIRDNLIAGCIEGISLIGTPAINVTGLVEGNVLRNLSSTGISGGDTTNLLVRNNQAESVAGMAIWFGSSPGVRIVGNSVSGDGQAGIRVEDTTGGAVIDNSVTNASLHGFQFIRAHGLLIQGNVAAGNGRVGLLLEFSDSNRIRNNVVIANGEEGILFIDDSGRNHVEGSTLRDNTLHGLRMLAASDDSVISLNTARGNGGGDCGLATCGGSDFCDQGTNNTLLGDNLMPGPLPC